MSAIKRFIGVVAIALVTFGLTGCEDEYGFDRVEVGSDQASTPRPRSNAQFVRSLFADALGRSPEVYEFVIYGPDGDELQTFEIDEQEFLLAALDSYGDERLFRAFVAHGLLASNGADMPAKTDVDDPEQFIVDQFRKYLGREPGQYELHAFLDAWNKDDAVTPVAIVRALVGSREYQSF